VGHALFDTNAAVLTECGFSRESLVAANINPATGLATDYLNHFNEITMLIGQGDFDIPVFDTTRIHAEAAVEFMLP